MEIFFIFSIIIHYSNNCKCSFATFPIHLIPLPYFGMINFQYYFYWIILPLSHAAWYIQLPLFWDVRLNGCWPKPKIRRHFPFPKIQPNQFHKVSERKNKFFNLLNVFCLQSFKLKFVGCCQQILCHFFHFWCFSTVAKINNI